MFLFIRAGAWFDAFRGAKKVPFIQVAVNDLLRGRLPVGNCPVTIQGLSAIVSGTGAICQENALAKLLPLLCNKSLWIAFKGYTCFLSSAKKLHKSKNFPCYVHQLIRAEFARPVFSCDVKNVIFGGLFLRTPFFCGGRARLGRRVERRVRGLGGGYQETIFCSMRRSGINQMIATMT